MKCKKAPRRTLSLCLVSSQDLLHLFLCQRVGGFRLFIAPAQGQPPGGQAQPAELIGSVGLTAHAGEAQAGREKCKAYNCYVRKTGTFIRQYSDFMKPEFRFDIKDKYSYFLLTEDFINSKQMVLSYVKHITDHLFNL